MSKVKESIDVDVPLHNVYDQWTQFEDFPRFMDGVEEVRQTDDRHCHWTTKVAGARREFDTEIVDQLPDERIAWRTVGGDLRQMGVVTFQRLDDDHTRVSLAMEFEPHGLAEKAGSMLGVPDRQVKGDLRRFKGFIEERGRSTGAWRGRLTPGGGPADGVGGSPAGPAGAPVREQPQARMTGEGAPPPPADPDDMQHG
ncbi:cyclase [Kitasatospora sp. NE20-6]